MARAAPQPEPPACSRARGAVGLVISDGEGDGPGPAGWEETERLARRAVSGDRGAMERLLRQDYPRLLRVCLRVLHDEHDAEDAVQEALVSIASKIRTFDGRSRYSTWSYRVAANAALDELRRRGRRRAVRSLPDLGGYAATGPSAHAAGDAAASGPTGAATHDVVEHGVVQSETVQWALSQLPKEQRDALVLRHFLDLGYSEIASIQQVPIGTVRSRIARGRMALAGLLGTAEAGQPSKLGHMGDKR